MKSIVSSNDDLQQQQTFPSIPCSDECITTEQFSIVCDKIGNMKTTSELLNNISQSSLHSSTHSTSFTYGVDWSDQAHFASHCWLPYSKNFIVPPPSSSNMSQSPARSKHTTTLPIAQCATCGVTLPTNDLFQCSEAITDTNQRISLCRPSFLDSNMADDVNTYDRHCWSQIRKLKKRCEYCNRKSLRRFSSHNNNRISVITTNDREITENSMRKPVMTYSDQNMSNLICLWCSRNYHRQRWENIPDNDKRCTCDYGVFGNIIVRPQWLRRVADSPAGFRAQTIVDSEINNTSLSPVIFFINKLSGGQKSEEIYRKLVRILNPRQVFLLESDVTITQALNIYSSLNNVRLCVCGGDGTIGWVLSHLMDVFPSLQNPPVAICPLGTGNDLSRILGWGHQYNRERLLRTLIQIPNAQPIALDRWRIEFEPLDITSTALHDEDHIAHQRCCVCLDHPKFIDNANRLTYENHLKPRNLYFFSHMSFGLDAAIALDFHVRRTQDPSKFTSPFKNKIIYLNESRKYFKEFFFSEAWTLGSYMKLICDGIDLTNSIQSCHTLLLLNSPGYGSGTNPWGRTLTNIRNSTASHQQTDDNSFHASTTSSTLMVDSPTSIQQFERQDFGDRKIEVLGLTTKQMGLIHLGFRGHRIAQCSQIRIEFNRAMPVQMDGEPFYLSEPIIVNILHAGQVFVLRKETRRS